MKALKRALPVLLIALAAFFATGCKQEDTRTQDECMTQFAAAVNSQSWGDIKDCTSSDANFYNLMSSDSWENYFGVGDGDFTYTVSGNSATGEKGGITYTFTLAEDGKDYYAISEIYEEGLVIPIFQ